MTESITTERLEFVYVGDPMCSWCWGFAPAVEQLRDGFNIPVRVVVGGLRPGDAAEPLDESMWRYLETTWVQVADRSGQPFDTKFLDRADGWIYDTELPAMAVVTMRRLRPEVELDFFTSLQRAFYAEGVDITDADHYPHLAGEFLEDTTQFLAEFTGDDARWAAWDDFSTARSWGIGGFPALLLRDGETLGSITNGFQPADRLVPAVADYLVNQNPVDGVVCTIDGYC